MVVYLCFKLQLPRTGSKSLNWMHQIHGLLNEVKACYPLCHLVKIARFCLHCYHVISRILTQTILHGKTSNKQSDVMIYVMCYAGKESEIRGAKCGEQKSPHT